ncbi:PREDICTED: uncharacterized protein LOC108558936 isoform X2 [Nicrophorus vespilloides]|uniref:Uncharacterized protein LOC108558936 isoform X2 n=1 Tax=Nicrophorus vespilloides TaxID=110193 RepID=A0ABM1MAB8_NICVS|nr:PREDICTED: uncharacterized protein LOC108558936 isoform X2 [Nicrophorus vespilloides]
MENQVTTGDFGNQTMVEQVDVSIQTNPNDITEAMSQINNRETLPPPQTPTNQTSRSDEPLNSFESVVVISSDEGRPMPPAERPRRRRRRPLQNIPIRSNGTPIIDANFVSPDNRNFVENPYATGRAIRRPNRRPRRFVFSHTIAPNFMYNPAATPRVPSDEEA